MVNPNIFEHDAQSPTEQLTNIAAQRAGLVSLEWIRIPSDACEQANSIWIRKVWTGKKKKLPIQKYPDSEADMSTIFSQSSDNTQNVS